MAVVISLIKMLMPTLADFGRAAIVYDSRGIHEFT